MANEDIEKKVRTVIMRVFHLSQAEAQGKLRMGSILQWDSLGHMDLIAEIEKEFSLSFPSFALADLVDVEAIVNAIEMEQVK